MMLTKKCSHCQKIKELYTFSKDTSSKDGLQGTCKSCRKQQMMLYQISGKLKIAKDKYRASDAGQEKIKKYTASDANKAIQKSYRQSTGGRAVCTAKLAKYRANKKKAIPAFSDLKTIDEIYKNRPEGHEVDHIVPLQGKNVCGLHVSWNLQYLPIKENRKKGNRAV